MDAATIGVMGMMLAPLYGIIIWRLKASRQIDIKLTKVCMFLKLKYPEYSDLLK